MIQLPMHHAPVIARNVFWLATGEAVVKGSILVVSALVGRLIGPAGLGELTVSWGAMLMAVTIMAGGQVEVLVRATATKPDIARQHLVDSLRVFSRLAVITTTIAVAAAILVERPGMQACLVAFIPYAVLRARVIVSAAPHKGLDRMGVETAARSLESVIAVPLLALLAMTVGQAWVAGLAFAAGALVANFWIVRQHRHFPRAAEPPSRPEQPVWREGMVFLALALTFQLLLRSDTLLLALLGIPSDRIGQYGVASMWVWGVLAGPQLLAMAIYPTFSRMAHDRKGAAVATWTAVGLGGGCGLLLAGALWGLAEPLVTHLYGTGFQEASGLLATLSWALPGAGAAMCLGTVLAAWQRQRWSLLLWLAAVLVTVAADLYWIPRAGPSAAAVVAVAVQSALCVLLVAAALRAGQRPLEAP